MSKLSRYNSPGWIYVTKLSTMGESFFQSEAIRVRAEADEDDEDEELGLFFHRN